MKLAITLAALVAVAVASPQYNPYGQPSYGQAPYNPNALPQPAVDTPEVVAAKAAHFQAHAAARSQNGAPAPYQQPSYQQPAYQQPSYQQPAYQPYQAAPQYNPQQYNPQQYNPAPYQQQQYQAPQQYNQYNQGAPGGLPQVPQDTPEVAAAKAAHLQAHAAAQGHAHYG